MEMTLKEFTTTVTSQANAFASAWSAAGEKFAAQVAAEGGSAVLTAQRQTELLAQSMGQEFSNLAASSERWAAAATAQGNAGIAEIMNRYAQQYATKANALLDPVLTAEARVGALAAEAKMGVEAAQSAFGGAFGRAIGPAYDAYQMADGALTWAETGNSDSFGQAAMGVALSALGGIALGGLLAFAGLPALGVAAFAALGAGLGSLMGPGAYDAFNQWASEQGDFWTWLFNKAGQMNSALNTLFQSAVIFTRPGDPLTLDLDGDGLETVGINPSSPILFDHDADGVKTATGWVEPDDAFLVFDRNGNGTIDTGRELFGDSTALYAGGLAADGFAALAQEDTNQDGLVSAADANWNSLRLWRDLNQDGVSQANELLTLASQGITALKVARTEHSQTLANGNQIADLGACIRTDGSEGVLGEVVAEMGDINLASNPFFSQYSDSIPLTEAAQGIADMQGSGRVRGLREAASVDGGGASLFMQLNAGNQSLFDQSYAALNQWVYDGLVLQIRLKGYLDTISLTADEGGVRMAAVNDFEWRRVA